MNIKKLFIVFVLSLSLANPIAQSANISQPYQVSACTRAQKHGHKYKFKGRTKRSKRTKKYTVTYKCIRCGKTKIEHVNDMAD